MKLKIITLSCLALSACMGLSGQDGKPLAKMTFAHITPEPVYVASYEAVGLSTNKTPFMPVGFVSDPSVIAYDYLKNRFAAAGTTGKLRAVIQDVKVTHEILPSENQVGAALGIGKRDRYFITLDMSLESLGGNGFDRQSVALTANREVYVSEHVSIVQREKAQMEAMDSMLDDLDISIQKVLKEQFRLMD